MRNVLRTFIVGLMVLALTFNPAMACHFCGGGGYGYYSYQPVYYSSGCGGCGGSEVVVSDDCGGCGDCGSCDDCGSSDGCDSCGGEVVESSTSETKQESAPKPPVETPTEVRPELPATQPEQPATVERPVDIAPVEPALPPHPAPVATSVPPVEDLFNGTEPATPPAETPVVEAPTATEAPATEAPATEPATEPADDLFSPPAEEPAETTPAESAAPAETPATEEATDDLFGGTESTETTPPATDAAPPATDAPAETPAEAPAEGEQPAEETDDIFGARNVLQEAGGLASNEMRMWVDNTGSYSVNARLVRFVDGHVRLMKENGRTTTVPLNRLSERDLQFVNRQATAQKATTLQTVQVTSVSSAVSN